MANLNDLLDYLDLWLCQRSLLRAAHWDMVRSGKVTALYAGRLYRGRFQFRTHLGITPFEPSLRNIGHDVRATLPLPEDTVDTYQSEDVFEHIPYADIPAIIEDVYRVLKPGGLFRFSLPDYRNEMLRSRTLKDSDGNLVFDPGGGGAWRDGQVADGGHVWFPVFESVKTLFDQSSFGRKGKVRFLHYTRPDGTSVLEEIDYSRGDIRRTPDHDARAQNPRRALSIVVDAVK